jgi:hypothetical protein
MTDQPSVVEFDGDEAVAEAMAGLHEAGNTRGAFFRRAGAAAGGLGVAAALVPAFFGGTAGAREGGSKKQDVEILNFALTLEYLEQAFYSKGLKTVSGLSSDTKKLATEIRDNETAHVDALTKAIESAGGKAVAAPEVDFGDAYKSEKGFLKLAQTFEDTGVSAYNGAGPAISDPAILAAAGSIVQIEARHAALIRLANGDTPAPDAFDKALEKDAVLKAVMPFITG